MGETQAHTQVTTAAIGAGAPRAASERPTPVAKLKLGAGDIFEGECIDAIGKAVLQAGVSYVGGYPGAPVSHILDVFADARAEVLEPLGVQVEQSASEAGAAALLGASIHYPLRGFAAWKSIVGTNVASDALSNLASAGVTGGAVVLVGEDYGEGASVIQERTHAFALKSSLPLIDPRYELSHVVNLVEHAFALSEACHLPVMMSLRIRACHMTGQFRTKDNRPARTLPAPLLAEIGKAEKFDFSRIPLPPASYAQEKAKFEDRLPAARRFIVEHQLNEHRPGRGDWGLIVPGGMFTIAVRALRRLGLADAQGNTEVPLLVLNVIHPLVEEQIIEFLDGKSAVLVIEEGSPAYLENQVRAMAQRHGRGLRVCGKDLLPEAGEYTVPVVRRGINAFVAEAGRAEQRHTAAQASAAIAQAVAQIRLPQAPMPVRPPGFCTGCPERPVFAALKLVMKERGPLHISSDIGCNTFATLPPFSLGSTVLGYGLSLASGGAIAAPLGQPTVAIMGDGGFWHNGLTSGVVNAQWNNSDAVLIILENGYASATGQHHLPSTGSTPWGTPAHVSIEATLRGLGITWIRRVDSYAVSHTMTVLKQALDWPHKGLRVIISDGECMLAKKRRGNARKAAAHRASKPTRTARFGVDEALCTGDRSCMTLSGCPALTLAPRRDPLTPHPTTAVDSSCVACALCGENAQAARLCPSFYRAQGVHQPSPWQRLRARVQRRVMTLLGAEL